METALKRGTAALGEESSAAGQRVSTGGELHDPAERHRLPHAIGWTAEVLRAAGRVAGDVG